MSYIVYLVLFAGSTIPLVYLFFSAKMYKDSPLYRTYRVLIVACFLWSVTAVFLALPPIR